jgi:hypothetical protein
MSTRGTSSSSKQSSRRRNERVIWAAAGSALLALAVVVALATGSQPDQRSHGSRAVDGADCVTASSSEIRAWVRSHRAEIPTRLPLSDVARQVEKECEGGLEIFNATLLADAVNSAAVTRQANSSP